MSQTENSNIPHNSIYAIVIDKNKNKWIGTYGNGLGKINFTSEEKEWVHFNTSNSLLPHNWILSAAVDNENNLWV